uniref:PWWP domain-containing protein n=1 Tax=Cuerna arida TaxID=1464854 RepID=A0A1B6H007_9HEMI
MDTYNMDLQNKSPFTIGEYVFAKLRGCPHWPAVITEINLGKNKNKYRVTFFGDHKSAEIKQAYLEYKITFGQPKTDNFKNKLINQALREADQSYSSNKCDNPCSVLHDSNQELEDTQQAEAQVCQPTINDIQTKIQNSNDSDLETSLSLAAEAGNILLSENYKLKQDLHEMTLKNSHLAKQIMDSTQIGQTRYEMQIEELEKENEKLLSRTASLVDTIQQLEIKLSKEKELRIQLEALFEEQDQDKEKAICKYENDILQLKETIDQLKNETQNLNYKNTKSSIVKKNSETQTNPTTSETPNNSPVLFTQIAQLSIRQDTLEQQMKSLQDHSKILDSLCLAKYETDKFQSSGETIPHHLVQDRTKKPNEDLTGRVSQTPTKKLNSLQTGRARQTPTKKLKNSKNILTNPTASFTNTNSNKMRRDNMFSVSLQVAKSKAQVYSAEVPTPPGLDVNITHPVYPQLGQNTQIKSLLGFPRSPPAWAKIREEGESVQEFFNRYIEEYKIISLGTQPKHETTSGQEHCPGKAHLSTTAENSNSKTKNDNYPDNPGCVQHNQADSPQPHLDRNDTSQSTNPQIHSDISTDMSTFLDLSPKKQEKQTI